MENRSEVYRRKNNGTKTLPCGTPDTTLTSLLLQPSTITCCDRFDRSYVNIDNTEPQILTEQSLYRINRWLTLSKAALKSICTILASCMPTLQCTLQCMRHTQKCITVTQTCPLSKLGGWKHTTAFHKSSEANRHQALKHLRPAVPMGRDPKKGREAISWGSQTVSMVRICAYPFSR